jgi:pimeloyl-ACP methyl ester carboxylesterase
MRHSLLEASRFFLELGSSLLLNPVMRALPRGDGHTVMALPGFFGADGSTAFLRRFLKQKGYRAIPWGLGRNNSEDGLDSLEAALRFRAETEANLAAHLELEVQRSGRKVSLVGWSLGGLYSTALAHRYPDLIRQVITLGTPFGDPRGTALYGVMQRANNSEVSEELLDEWVGYTFRGELKVPVTALYSESDGIVGSGIALCPRHPLMENIAVMASHVGFPFNPLVRAVVAERLAQEEGAWKPFGLKCGPLVKSGDRD